MYVHTEGVKGKIWMHWNRDCYFNIGRMRTERIKGKQRICVKVIYLCDIFSSVSLFCLTAIIEKQYCDKSLEEHKHNVDKQIFVVDATKCWKRIAEYITTHSG